MDKNLRKAVYMDARRPVEARVRDLMARMTLEERIRQMGMGYVEKMLKDGRPSLKAMREFFKGDSIGCLQDPRRDPRTNVAAVNATQRYLVERTRLGIPALVISECLHGHGSGGATVFPQAIALGSTWSPQLVGRMAEVIAREARAVGVAQALSPDLDLARDPRWGRVEESYGEDPYLVGCMGVAYVRGMQGEGPIIGPDRLICTLKHFAAHGSPEAGMNLAPVAGGLRDLYMTYLPPFKSAVAAGALSVMPCYSEYDGVPAHASKLLMTRVLREQWGFLGYTFADYGGVSMLETFHRSARNAAEAGKQALLAGLDLEAPSEYGFGAALLELVRKGEVPVEAIDRAVARILRVKFLAGLFENPYADARRAARVVHAPAHRTLAREIARESIILLKNKKRLLPLGAKARTIAVIGPNSDVAQLGNYTHPGSGGISPLEGLRRIAPKGTRILHARGCGLTSLSRDGFAEAVEIARRADVAIVVIGDTSGREGGVGWGKPALGATCGEGFDRTELKPPGVQDDLVRAVYATGTPTVVVLVHGRPYSIEWMAGNIPAIVEAWYPGEEGGVALAEVLFGKVNPSGKLTVSVPRSAGHVPCFYNHKPSARGFYKIPGTPESPGRDYIFSSPAPLFEFGHGLSYTTFAYSRLRVAPRKILPGGQVNVSVEIRNSGSVAGKEVVQLYLRDVVSSVSTPVRSLRRFEKVFLRPGERKTVRFALGPEDLMLLDADMKWAVEPGEFRVSVGRLSAKFEVVGHAD